VLCAKLMVGRRLPQILSINRLTSLPDSVLSKCRRSRHAEFQHIKRRHPPIFATRTWPIETGLAGCRCSLVRTSLQQNSLDNREKYRENRKFGLQMTMASPANAARSWTSKYGPSSMFSASGLPARFWRTCSSSFISLGCTRQAENQTSLCGAREMVALSGPLTELMSIAATHRAVWPAEWHPCTRIPCRSDRSRALR
jgi:hypothetical protein